MSDMNTAAVALFKEHLALLRASSRLETDDRVLKHVEVVWISADGKVVAAGFYQGIRCEVTVDGHQYTARAAETLMAAGTLQRKTTRQRSMRRL